MVHCVVHCRQVNKSGSRDVSYLVAIFNVLDSTVELYMAFLVKAGLFLDEVFFDGRRYSVQDQSFVKFVRVAQKGYWRVAFRFRRVFPWF